MKTLLFPLALAALVCPPQAPAVDDATAKARLESALKATGLSYETSSSGLSFRLTYEHEAKGEGEDRQQIVYVSAAPSRPGNLIVHSVYTVAWIGGTGDPKTGDSTTGDPATGEPNQELLLHLLTTTKKLGSFYVHQDSQGVWSIRFGVQFDATDLKDDSKAGDRLVARLRDTISLVNLVGEEADAAVNGEKDVR